MFIKRPMYAKLFGPTQGDKIRLADTHLFAEVERDYSTYGDEILVGWGRNLRDGIMQSNRAVRNSAVDVLITNVLIVDPILGIVKGNIGIKEGLIAAVGNAGNPDIKDNVDLLVDNNTSMIMGEGLIATPGGVDSHVHLLSTRLVWTALSAGVTSFIGGGAGGTFGIATSPEYLYHRMFEAFEAIPLNIGFKGTGSSSYPEPTLHDIYAGACALKIHEDRGATPDVIENCLDVADQMDVAVCLHTDGLNESCYLEDTLQAIGERTVHAYHVEGVGGGHMPDILEIVGKGNIISSSTNPTIPYTINTAPEHKEMIMAVHKLNAAIPEDVAIAKTRVREYTMAAESILHDMGAISIINSDSMGMGRIGETIRKTWQLADLMKKGDRSKKANDNERILRYIAKYTINPAITHGISSYVGSLEPGKLADIVLWKPSFFGVKPEMVIKNGLDVWTVSGDGNASVRGSEPTMYCPGFSSMGAAASSSSLNFVSQASLDEKLKLKVNTRRRMVPVKNTRNIGPQNLVNNNEKPVVVVNHENQEVTINGEKVVLKKAESVAMNSLYFFS